MIGGLPDLLSEASGGGIFAKKKTRGAHPPPRSEG
ncbi:hypothetical protein LA6_001305 [Marinibacterium anthonyi]|nr:hypothetical protein LA6_001305 [Marinibacterium anthonyi]